MRRKFTPQKGTPDQKHFEDGDGMAIVIFRTNTIPDVTEFYPVGGMLSDGTVRAITSNYSKVLNKQTDRAIIAQNFNTGLFASAPFTDAEATKIFEKSNFKF